MSLKSHIALLKTFYIHWQIFLLQIFLEMFLNQIKYEISQVTSFSLLFLQEELKNALKPLREKLKLFQKAKLTCEQTTEHIKVSFAWLPYVIKGDNVLSTTEKIIITISLQNQADHTERQIRAEFEMLHQFLRDEEASRLSMLKQEKLQKSQIMKDKIEDLENDITSLNNTIRSIEQEMRSQDIPFLKVTVFKVIYPKNAYNPHLHYSCFFDHLQNYKDTIKRYQPPPNIFNITFTQYHINPK